MYVFVYYVFIYILLVRWLIVYFYLFFKQFFYLIAIALGYATICESSGLSSSLGIFPFTKTNKNIKEKKENS